MFQVEQAKRSHLPDSKLVSGNLIFGSRSEVACACLLKRYLNLPILPGATFQRPLGHNKVADFYLPEQAAILEYHPIMFKHEFINRNSLRQFNEVAWAIPKEQREKLFELVRLELSHRYYQSRRFIMNISQDPQIRNADLICIENETELYYKVIRPWSKHCPKLAIFENEFGTIIQNVDAYLMKIANW